MYFCSTIKFSQQNYQDIFVRLQITDTNSNKKCIHGIFAVLDFFKMVTVEVSIDKWAIIYN